MITIGVFFLLLILHECAHVISAIIMGLKVVQIGLKTSPLPHLFVAIEPTLIEYKKYLFLFAGVGLTIILFFISIYYKFWNINSIYWGFAIQLIVETNPFYSDFTIAINDKQGSNNLDNIPENRYREDYRYSRAWYFHFLFWTIFILVLVKLKNFIL